MSRLLSAKRSACRALSVHFHSHLALSLPSRNFPTPLCASLLPPCPPGPSRSRPLTNTTAKSLVIKAENTEPADLTIIGPNWDPESPPPALPRLPFRFETGIGLFAKRKPRPFPPPFLSPPSGSFSEPLSTHALPRINGEMIRGVTNGDDAVFASDYFICANDGVGAWSMKPRGHAGLWSRLILHYWVSAIEGDSIRAADSNTMSIPSPGFSPDSIRYLQEAYDNTVGATTGAFECNGTTTATGAQLHFRISHDGPKPVVHVTNLGDCQVLIIRPCTHEVIFKSTEEWHWFDCPRQLGTNSPDTPKENAKVDIVDIQVNDIVLAMSDGVIDNLWQHEIVDVVMHSMERWEANEAGEQDAMDRMRFVAEALMDAAKAVALDSYAESPYMERAIEEGLASEGGKPDDISVVAARCVSNES